MIIKRGMSFEVLEVFPVFVHLKVRKYLLNSLFLAPVIKVQNYFLHFFLLHTLILHDELSKWMMQITP